MNRRSFLTRLAALVPSAALAQAAPLFAKAESGETKCVRVSFGDDFKQDHQNLPESIILPSELCESAIWRAAFIGVLAQRLEMTAIPVARHEEIAEKVDEMMRKSRGTLVISNNMVAPSDKQEFTWKGRVLVANWGLTSGTVAEMKQRA